MDKGYHIDWDTVWEQFDAWMDGFYAQWLDNPQPEDVAAKMQELVEAQLQQQRSS